MSRWRKNAGILVMPESPMTEAKPSFLAPPLPFRLTVDAGTYEIDPIADSRWAAFVDRHPSSSLFHTTGWLSALRNVYGYQPMCITTNGPGERLTNGIVMCRIKSWLTGARLVSLPFSDHCEPLAENTTEFEGMIAHLRGLVESRKWKYLEIRPLSFEPSNQTKLGAHLSYRFHRVDLTQSAAQLFKNFHKDCVQRKIRRAEKEKLRYEAGNSDELLQKFYRLMVGMRRRKSLPPQPIEWFRALAAEFGKGLQIRVASNGDLPVASIITLSHKRTMTYKYGCSDAAFNKLGGMALLFWRTIQEARAADCEEFDLGRSDSDNLGLIAFKDHWGAVSSPLTYWKYPEEPASRSSLWRSRIVQRAVSITPESALKAAGKLLYRHIG